MILVDEIVAYAHGPHGHRRWCHMMSDDHTKAGLAELHAMADRLGLRRAWFQDKPHFPHYDLTPPKRTMALRFGAQAVDSAELVRRCRRAQTEVAG